MRKRCVDFEAGEKLDSATEGEWGDRSRSGIQRAPGFHHHRRHPVGFCL